MWLPHQNSRAKKGGCQGKNTWRRGPRRQSLGPCQPINSAVSPHQNRSLLVALMDRALLELWICFGHLRLPSPCADLASSSSWYCIGVTAPRNYTICGIVLVCINSVCLDVQLVYLEHAQVLQGGLNFLAIAGRGARPCQCIFST